MTTRTTFERDLPAILEDLYLGPTPDYRDEVLAAVSRTRQRPSWTFAGRWIPMADIASRPVPVPRVPWRAVGLALLLIALLLATALVVGSRQTRVPPPFGLARNGLIAYAADGDIFTVDPTTSVTQALITGPDVDSEPMFSPDGTHIAFRRGSEDAEGRQRDDLVVVRADGSGPVVVTLPSLTSELEAFEWSPDSRSLLVDAAIPTELWLLDATHAAAPRVIASGATSYPKPFRPPAGDAILIQRATADPSGVRLSVLDIASGRETLLAEGGPSDDLGAARWSPDGAHVVYNSTPDDEFRAQRLFVVNADGTGTRQITDAEGTWFDIDPTWSPDGTRIAFTRYEQIEGSTWEVRPTGLYWVASGRVTDLGPLPREVRAAHPTAFDDGASAGEGFFLEWSPDATSLLALHGEASGNVVVIDAATGVWEILGPLSDAGFPLQAWQRMAQP